MESSHVVIKVKGKKVITFPSPPEVHALAVEKGWYDKCPNSENKERITPETMGNFFIPAQLGMIQSEALNAVFCHHTPMEREYELLEDESLRELFTEEFADVVLRCFDCMGFLGIDMSHREFYCIDFSHGNNSDVILCLVCEIQESLRRYRKEGIESLYTLLPEIARVAISIAEHFNLNLEEAVADKHEFNKTREYRHGNKFV